MPAKSRKGRSLGCRYNRTCSQVPGRRARSLRWVVTAFMLVSLALCPLLLLGQSPVLTYHGDYTRSGLYSTETLLTPGNVNPSQFGKLFFYNVDGFIVGQPLYMPNVTIPGSGVHNVVYVTTLHDSIYAFDADNLSAAPLWQVSLINQSGGVTTVPISAQGCPSTGFTETGILGTPVIAGPSGTMYFVAKTQEVSGGSTNYVFRLHALDITTGLEKLGGPLVISASIVAPNGNTDTFQPQRLLQRPALLLENNVLYVGFGSNGCDFSAQGWFFAFDSGIVSGSLQQLAVLNTAPNVSYGASIWQSGEGPAGDGNGNVFFSTANGTFDFSTGGPDLGDSVIKTSYSSGSMEVDDYFTPFDQGNMSVKDLDLGSGGPLVLLNQPGQVSNLLITSGKTGGIYLLNMDSLGGYNPLGNSQIVQYLPEGTLGPFYSTPVFWNNNVYFAANADNVKAFSLTNGLLSSSPTIVSKSVLSGGSPVISVNGNTNSNAILWIVANPANPLLEAMNAASLTLLYNSSQVSNRDTLGSIAHFATPLDGNGRIYVGTQTQLIAYGLYPILSTSSGNSQSGTVGTTLPQPIQVQALNSLRAPVPGVVVSFSDSGAGGTFSNPTVTTDSTGTATTNYTLPTKAGMVFIKVSAPTFTTLNLSATALAGPPANIRVMSGSAQSGKVTTQLPQPVVVRLQDSYKNAAPGLPVQFSDNGVGGSFSPSNPVITDSLGNATVSYTLPTVAKVLTLSAAYSSLNVNFGETSLAGSPTTQKISSGSNQQAPPNTQLPKPLVTLVTDQYGNPVSGVTVTFTDNSAGGTFSGNPATTNSHGLASVFYTTSSQAGLVTITASAPNVNSVTFNENVQ